ncbi:hypothetical protein IWC96_14380 [Brevundimonas sp. BAL450]|uniref:hypothetical protein n=1 Tax=Brevundimonas sp. BAL450 TaxID=1708162 RepID=UPI0018C8F909|nr:hypothetical protein [Brevundimonas sp. BAL450]MBG7616461.1 hypothetical protein [Brevundimonas sp. BAL450]
MASRTPPPDHIPLPDWAGRRHAVWQIFDRAWRPAAHWNVVIGVGYVCWFGHAIGRPMDEPYAWTVLGFAGLVIWNKTFEKLRGVA